MQRFSVLALTIVAFVAVPSLSKGRDSEGENVKLTVKRFEIPVGEGPDAFTENTYVAYDAKSKNALLIDPGGKDQRIADWIQGQDLKIGAILLTHGHWDHIGGVSFFRKMYECPVYVHELEKPILPEALQKRVTCFQVEPKLPIEQFEITYFHIPGHTKGAVAYRIGDAIFSGDILFKESVGRTWGTQEEQDRKEKMMVEGIKEKLLTLPGDTRVFPGHRDASTIEYEEKHNPYLQ